MPELQTVYHVRIPMDGQPDGYCTLVRALSPDMAGECVRVLLSCGDPRITEVRLVVAKELRVQE